ncbi:MAG: hypothetical protein RLZZ524_423 [Pseudomonadota bacterium]
MARRPASPAPDAPDARPLTDRLLARIRDNRIAAVLILASLAIGGLASLGESVRTLAAWLPGAGSGSALSAGLAGPWKTTTAADFREAGPEYLRLDLQDAPGGRVTGELQFSGNERLPARRLGLIDGQREGTRLSLRHDSGRYLIASGGTTRVLSETLTGEIGPDELRLVFQVESRAPVALTARRVDPASQRVAGRLALVHEGRAFDDHRAACEQVLRSLTPPQTYVRSEPPTEAGDVRCVGARADGRVDFDMHDAGIRLTLLCPPDSRPLPGPEHQDRQTDRCECDADLQARAGACVAPG